ncbi:MAG: VanZ family protein [Ruminococcaceae bacterium]|nr:VanZ family protein [Oscillospiraceae bacterium]
MTKINARKIVFICFLVLTAVWIVFVFSNSLDNGVESGEKSSAVTSALNSALTSVGIKKPISERDVRTFAHFSEFFVLTALLSADVLLCPLSKKIPQTLSFLSPFISVPVCFLVACIDELIQNFSAGRAMQFSDVCVDTLGGICAATLFTLICLSTYLIRLKKSKK